MSSAKKKALKPATTSKASFLVREELQVAEPEVGLRHAGAGEVEQRR